MNTSGSNNQVDSINNDDHNDSLNNQTTVKILSLAVPAGLLYLACMLGPSSTKKDFFKHASIALALGLGVFAAANQVTEGYKQEIFYWKNKSEKTEMEKQSLASQLEATKNDLSKTKNELNCSTQSLVELELKKAKPPENHNKEAEPASLFKRQTGAK